jgi:hypothetical protein
LARYLPQGRGPRALLGVLTRSHGAGGSPPPPPLSLESDHDLAIALARDRAVGAFARELIKAAPPDRIARLTAVFTFVAHLMACPPPEEEPRDGFDVLLALAGERSGPAVILAALLKALGEKAALRSQGGASLVACELGDEDLERLPPHAAVLYRGRRALVLLDPRSARTPFGFVPCRLQEALGGARRDV